MNHINVIFPLAGDSSRFNYDFKPFIFATDKTFIELAKSSFDILHEACNITYIFTFRKDHEQQYNVEKRIVEMFPKDNIKCCILEKRTDGPLETVKITIEELKLTGKSFVCDCDHMINISPMISYIDSESGEFDILIPTWPIHESEYSIWGKIKFDENNNIVDFYEKEKVPFSKNCTIKGLVGCYLFRDIEVLLNYENNRNISELLQIIKESKYKNLKYCDIEEAAFFGDLTRLYKFRECRAKSCTLFVDIDGTLVEQSNDYNKNLDKSNLVLPGTIEKMKAWKRDGHKIIITTGRQIDENELAVSLLEKGILFDKILTRLPTGPRCVINDKKPYNPLIKMAQSYDLVRNGGIHTINIGNPPEIVALLKGMSFSQTYLIKLDGSYLVRKYIYKSKQNIIHYDILKRQYEDLKRFQYYLPNIVPAIKYVEDNINEYFFDMEYLEKYEKLSSFDSTTQNIVLNRLIRRMKENIYCYRKSVDGKTLLENYIRVKIDSKLAILSGYGEAYHSLIHDNDIKINGLPFKGIIPILKKLDMSNYYSEYVSPIHGDLTLENIMYNSETDDVKLIDMAGSNYVDMVELDISKMLQSLIAKYEKWEEIGNLLAVTIVNSKREFHITDSLFNFNEIDYYEIINQFFDQEIATDSNKNFKKSLFHLALHLIRNSTYMFVKNELFALNSLALAVVYLNYVEL